MIIKPLLLVSNDVPLSAKQLDIFNYLLQQAYLQLVDNYMKTTFYFTVGEIRNISKGELNSKSKIIDYFRNIKGEDFTFNIMGTDKTIKSNVTSKFITFISDELNSDKLEIGLEPYTITALRNMVIKMKGIKQLPGISKKEFIDLKIQPYISFEETEHNDIKFYPAKVILEIIMSNVAREIKEIDFEYFKKMTNTENKYKANYKKMVLDKIEEILNKKYPELNVKISTNKKHTRYIQSITISSFVNKHFSDNEIKYLAKAWENTGIKYWYQKKLF